MSNNLFISNLIPIILLILGGVFILLDNVNIERKRKVTIRNHTKRTSHFTTTKRFITFLKSKLHNIDSYNMLLDIGQFIFGYFYEFSEKKNRDEFEKFLFRRAFFTTIISIIFLILPIDMIAKLGFILSLILMQIYLVKWSVKRQKEKLEDEFYKIIREFIVGYELTHSVVDAFEYVIKEVPGVYKIHISRLVNELTSNTSPTEAFRTFNRRMNNDMCIAFLDIVESAYSSKDTITVDLKKLQNLINGERKIKKEQKAGINKKGIDQSIWIVALIVELFVEGYIFRTSSGNYFLTTEIGQYLLILSIGSIILSIVLYNISSNL